MGLDASRSVKFKGIFDMSDNAWRVLLCGKLWIVMWKVEIDVEDCLVKIFSWGLFGLWLLILLLKVFYFQQKRCNKVCALFIKHYNDFMEYIWTIYLYNPFFYLFVILKDLTYQVIYLILAFGMIVQKCSNTEKNQVQVFSFIQGSRYVKGFT